MELKQVLFASTMIVALAGGNAQAQQLTLTQQTGPRRAQVFRAS